MSFDTSPRDNNGLILIHQSTNHSQWIFSWAHLQFNHMCGDRVWSIKDHNETPFSTHKISFWLYLHLLQRIFTYAHNRVLQTWNSQKNVRWAMMWIQNLMVRWNAFKQQLGKSLNPEKMSHLWMIWITFFITLSRAQLENPLHLWSRISLTGSTHGTWNSSWFRILAKTS